MYSPNDSMDGGFMTETIETRLHLNDRNCSLGWARTPAVELNIKAKNKKQSLPKNLEKSGTMQLIAHDECKDCIPALKGIWLCGGNHRLNGLSLGLCHRAKLFLSLFSLSAKWAELFIRPYCMQYLMLSRCKQPLTVKLKRLCFQLRSNWWWKAEEQIKTCAKSLENMKKKTNRAKVLKL